MIYVGNRTLPGALDAIAQLRDAGLPVRFLTNTTRTPKSGILRRLGAMGLTISEDELFTPAEAARKWLAAHECSPHLLIHPDLRDDFLGLSDWSTKAVVVGDAGTGFTFEALNAAVPVAHGRRRILALASNRTFRDADGELSLDAGAFVAALEFSTQRSAIVLGKPSEEFFSAALASMNCAAGDAVMVGDDAEMDIAGALSAGACWPVCWCVPANIWPERRPALIPHPAPL